MINAKNYKWHCNLKGIKLPQDYAPLMKIKYTFFFFPKFVNRAYAFEYFKQKIFPNILIKMVINSPLVNANIPLPNPTSVTC